MWRLVCPILFSLCLGNSAFGVIPNGYTLDFLELQGPEGGFVRDMNEAGRILRWKNGYGLIDGQTTVSLPSWDMPGGGLQPIKLTNNNLVAGEGRIGTGPVGAAIWKETAGVINVVQSNLPDLPYSKFLSAADDTSGLIYLYSCDQWGCMGRIGYVPSMGSGIVYPPAGHENRWNEYSKMTNIGDIYSTNTRAYLWSPKENMVRSFSVPVSNGSVSGASITSVNNRRTLFGEGNVRRNSQIESSFSTIWALDGSILAMISQPGSQVPIEIIDAIDTDNSALVMERRNQAIGQVTYAIWNPVAGVVPINGMVADATAGYSIYGINHMNDKYQLAVTLKKDGNTYIGRLSPVPEPASMCSLISAITAFGLRKRAARRKVAE